MEHLGNLAALLMTMFLLSFLILFVYVVIRAVIKSIEERKSDEGKFKELEAVIDDSLKRYRECRKSRSGQTINWHCIAKLFTFSITMRRDGFNYVLDISFHFPMTTVDEETAGHFDTSRELKIEKRVQLPKQQLEELFSRLQFFDSLHIDTNGVAARKELRRLPAFTGWPEALSGIITFVRYLIDYEKRKDLKISRDALCPYCRSELSEKDDLVSCRVCRTFHHRDCWEEMNECSVFGCRG